MMLASSSMPLDNTNNTIETTVIERLDNASSRNDLNMQSNLFNSRDQDIIGKSSSKDLNEGYITESLTKIMSKFDNE